MIVEQYGLRYLRVTEEDLELLRYWRNQSFISSTMQFKEFITPKMQKEWFKKIDNKHNYYFIILSEGKKIGLINCKDSGMGSSIAEGGIFIWDQSFWGSSIPAFASLTMLEGVFEVFKSGKASLATVVIENTKALNFNLMLGYKIIGKTADEKCYKLLLTIEDYFLTTKRFLKASKILSGNKSELKIIADISDKQADEINNYILNQKK